MLAECITHRNPKNGETIESRLTNEEAIEILSKQTGNNFCQSLVTQYNDRGLSDAQWYWAHKIANEKSRPAETTKTGDKTIDLGFDLYTWLKQTELKRLMWRVMSDEKNYARIKLYINEAEISVVHSGGDFAKRVGYIDSNNVYHPNTRVPKNVQIVIGTQLMALAKYKMDFMQQYGREWGVCFVCGRQLESEESVRLGIGPICANRFGG